jgi:hypothetical protein
VDGVKLNVAGMLVLGGHQDASRANRGIANSVAS